ncbi:MAG TPA: hypothetical protein VF012_00460 [Nocardioidaceae bacterium]
MKAVLLVTDGDTVPAWQYDALRMALDHGLEVVLVAHCTGAPDAKPGREHLAFDLLARTASRTVAALRPVNVRPLLPPGVPEVSFTPETTGASSSVPPDVADRFRGADVVVNFGLGRLGETDSLPVAQGVLSYRGSGPGSVEGQLAGFHAFSTGAEMQEVVLQRQNGEPGRGEVLARAFAPVVRHSYTGTVANAYTAAVPLLAKAVTALEAGSGGLPEAERVDRVLPSNTDVAHQGAVVAARKVRRLAYGILRDQLWQVGRLMVPFYPESLNAFSGADVASLDIPPGYFFVADPHGGPHGAVYVELLDGHSGKGEIARWKAGEWSLLDLDLKGGHASYPQVVEDEGTLFLFPEIARVASPTLYRLAADGVTVTEKIPLQGLEDQRLLDATLFRHEGLWYLFGGTLGSEALRLDLWVAPKLTGPFRPHPSSPVCLDPRNARMAGPLTLIGGCLYRFGQDGVKKYGSRVTVSRVDVLTEHAYEETVCGSLEFTDCWGPHTVSMNGDDVWVDYFTEVTTPMAGVRRFGARYSRGGKKRRPRG